MFRMSAPRIAVLAILFTAAGISSGGSPTTRIVPARGEKITFKKVYSSDRLKNYTLQKVTKTSFTLKNTKGLLTATWEGTFRNVATDEKQDLSATGICKAHSSRKIECTFDASAGTVNVTAQPNHEVIVSIPMAQGVQFSREAEGIVHSEILFGFGEDEEFNNTFRMNKVR